MADPTFATLRTLNVRLTFEKKAESLISVQKFFLAFSVKRAQKIGEIAIL
jgi:hypothetical protein